MSRLLLVLLCVLAPVSAAQSPELAARSKAASQAMTEGRFEDAARIYQELSQALPNDPGLSMNLGMALAMGGREPEAIPHLERAIELKPDLLPAHLFLGSSYLAVGEPAKAIPPLERVVAAQPAEIEHRRILASAYAAVGRHADAVTHLRRVTELNPKLPAAWYGLGHAYNAVAQEAIATFERESADSPWAQLLVADALFADGRLTDAFTAYRTTLDRLPEMVTIRDAVAKIYERSGHSQWAVQERAKAIVAPAGCARRKAMCEFRAGRYRAALAAALAGTDPESRYWQVRAATELALAAFKRLDALPDSRERREVRATLALSERRYVDAVGELKAALKFAPADPALVEDLGTAYYSARDYEQAAATLAPLVKANPKNVQLLTMYGDSLLSLQRVDEAVAVLQRAVDEAPGDATARLALGRALVQKQNFTSAIPLLEPLLESDEDGSVHVQLARAYTGAGQREQAEALLKRSQELQRAAQERNAAAGQRTITPPK